MSRKQFILRIILVIVALLLFQLFYFLNLREEIQDSIEIQIDEIYEQNHPMNQIVVYVTTYGEKYHADNCRYLYKSQHETTLRRAVLNGYTDCSRCVTPKYVAEYDGIDTYEEYLGTGYLDILLSEYEGRFKFLFVVIPCILIVFIVFLPVYFLWRKPKEKTS